MKTKYHKLSNFRKQKCSSIFHKGQAIKKKKKKKKKKKQQHATRILKYPVLRNLYLDINCIDLLIARRVYLPVARQKSETVP